MDLSKLSTEDLQALQAGELSRVSDAGLMALRGAQPQAPRKLTPEETPGFGQTMLIGAGRTFDRIGKGMQQLYYGATGNQKELAALRTAAEADDEAYKPLQEARPWATGIGEALPSMALPGAGAGTLAGNAARMAVAGAAPGALEYGTAEDRAQRAALGAAAGAALPAIGGVARAGWSLAEPLYAGGRQNILARTLNRVAGNDAAGVASRMANARELVPGSTPTAAEVAESGGIAALQRSASNANPQAYTERQMQQASARLNALRGIAGDDVAMQQAVAKRQRVGGQAYARAEQSGVDSGMADALKPQISSLLERDEIKAAIAEARSLAKSEGFDLGSDLGSVRGLQYLKQALDDKIAELPDRAKNKARVWGKTSADLKSVLDEIVPDLRQADRVYARLSRPVNRMQVGQELLNQVQPALADFGALGSETGAQFARALRNADGTAARALDRPGAKMADVLSPPQMDAVTAVAQDLARKSSAQNLGRGVGSDTFQKFAMANIAAQSGMPRLTQGLLSLPGLGRATNWLYRDADQKMMDEMAGLLLDPKAAAKVMTKSKRGLLADDTIARQLLEQSLLRPGLLGAPAAYSLAE